MSEKRKKIAILGAGVSGIVSAYLLQDLYDVTLFEAADRIGGHTNTVTIEKGPDAGARIDTGFIVCNDRTYPLFHSFLDRIGVSVRDACMSFGYYSEVSGLQYAGTNLFGLFAQKRNIFKPAFIKMLLELKAFNAQALKDLESKENIQGTLREYIARYSYSEFLVRDYLVPMGAAIWSSPDDGILDFPVATFLHFFKNHGLLTLADRPQWQTVTGGSIAYVEKFKETFKGSILVNSPVVAVSRLNESVTVTTKGGHPERFDIAVVATHADKPLKFLQDPSENEQKLLSVWEYQKNPTILHSDPCVMPPLKEAWASWNYTREKMQDGQAPVSVTYHMNRLQGLDCCSDYFVTLNRNGDLNEDLIHARIDYDHPIFSSKSVATQAQLPKLQGYKNTYYCGSYFGFGFHEDAVRSAVKIADLLGAKL